MCSVLIQEVEECLREGDEEETGPRARDEVLDEDAPPFRLGIDRVGGEILERREQSHEAAHEDRREDRRQPSRRDPGEPVEHEQRRPQIDEGHRENTRRHSHDERDGDAASRGIETSGEAFEETLHARQPFPPAADT